MPAIDLMVFLLMCTFGAVIINSWTRRRDQAVYRHLASQHRMHYSPADPLRLTPRVAAHLPIPGAAAVRVLDLLYRTDDLAHHYVFTVEYTVGTYGTKRRLRRAGALVESKSETAGPIDVVLGQHGAKLIDQYRELIK